MSNLNRRDFLTIARDSLLWLSAALGLGGILRFLSYEPNPAARTEFDVGFVDDFPPGSRTLLAEPPAVLFRSPDGFLALSLVCTHLGCVVEQEANGFICPCHGSQFDMDGKVTHGPAVNQLAWLRVEVSTENKVIIFTD